jgi:hypothetical protein
MNATGAFECREKSFIYVNFCADILARMWRAS